MSVTEKDFDLQAFLPYLLNRTGIRFAESFCDVVRPYDLGLGMWRVLAVLRRQPGIRMSELAHETSIELSTLSRQVTSMEARGLLRRGRSADDARAVEVVPTPEGLRIIEEILPAAHRYQEVLIQGLSDNEVQLLYSLIDRIYRNSCALLEPAVKA
jgi:DNA-binding MarR family transcriptional regulator